MAGSRKGKSKKNKGKSTPHKSEAINNQIESNYASDLGKKVGNILDKQHEHAKEFEDDKLEKLVYSKIELAYDKAYKIILNLNYSIDVTRNALLSAAIIVGEGNILSNILKNALTFIHSSRQLDGQVIFDKEPNFKDISELITFWVQELINLVQKKWPDLSKSEALQHILSSKLLAIEKTREEYISQKAECSSSSATFSDDKFNVDALLDENIASFKSLNLTHPSKSTSYLENSTTFVVNPQELHRNSIKYNQHSSKVIGEDESLNPFKCSIGCFDETSLEEFLRDSSGEKKEEMISNLKTLITSLEKQVNDRKEWAKIKEKEANEKLNRDTLELNMLRLEKEGKEHIELEKDELETSNLIKILEKEINRRMDIRQFYSTSRRVKKFETQILETRADIAAVTLNESESKMNLKQAVEKEKQDLKKIRNLENQITKFEGQIHEERERIFQMDQQLQIIEEAQKEAKLKFKQELEEKEHAHALFLEERKLTRIARENASRRLSSLQLELQIEHQRVMDEKERLMQELSLLSMSQPIAITTILSSSALELGESSQCAGGELPLDHKRCIICLEKEVSTLFIPCAHQVVCLDCLKNVKEHCPCCQVQIAKVYRVYTGSS